MAREQIKRKPAAAPVEVARGVLIRDGVRVEEDAWLYLADDESAPANADVVVSLARYQANAAGIVGHAGRIGVAMKPDDAVEDLGDDALLFALIVVQFPAFRDGRGLTTARLLRERYGYKGELRASGDVLEDQLFYMRRCGFDAFEIVTPDAEAVYARAMATFSHAYQGAADGRVSVFRQRATPDRATPGPQLLWGRKDAGLKARGPVWPTVVPLHAAVDQAARYASRFEKCSARELISWAALERWEGKFALVSSFGAESAVLLHLAAQVDRSIPVVFLDTDRHFAQTLQYRDELIEFLNLTNVIVQEPNEADAAREDARGDLWRTNGDACCDLRKVRPLAEALAPYEAWATGRKRFQGGLRKALQLVEHDGAHFKVNPLAGWTAEDVAKYFERHGLPAHPLTRQNFPSVGCWPCTKAAPGRSGRWAGAEKSECGIHRAPETLVSTLVSAG